MDLGLNIYTGGVALQLTLIAAFICPGLRSRQFLQGQDTKRKGAQKAWSSLLSTSVFVVFPAESQTLARKTAVTPERGYNDGRPLWFVMRISLSLILIRNPYWLAGFSMRS